MAMTKKKELKNGSVSYEIRVSLGRDITGKQILKYHTYTPEPGMSQKQIDKALEREKVLFEERCRSGEVLDTHTKFSDFAEMWLERKKNEHSPVYQLRARGMLVRINKAIGHIRVSEIKPYHLQSFIDSLQKPGEKITRASVASASLDKIRVERGMSKAALGRLCGVPVQTMKAACKGNAVSLENAKKISAGLGMALEKLFLVDIKKETLSVESVRYHHRIISSILESAVKWQIIHDNPAKRVELPKANKKEAAYLDDEQALVVIEALQTAPIKWRTMIMLLMYSGMRRGELCGLTWDDVDFQKGIVHIRKSNQYLPGMGVITKSTKTESSERVIRLPAEMFELLNEYHTWQSKERANSGDLWYISNNVFCQVDGKPIFPDSITKWVTKFRDTNNLPYFTPHTLRHTSATLLIMQGVPVKAVSARLGHACANTTNMIYSHAVKTADALASDVLGDILKPIKRSKVS